MDTRTKILTLEAAHRLQGPVALVIGNFDVLRASLVRELAEIRRRLPEGTALVAAVVPAPDASLPQHARAELAAGLRMLDYVVTADERTADRLGETLRCPMISRMSAADVSRARDLKEHVRRRQS